MIKKAPKKIVLGSNSPRRKEILSFFSLPFTTASPTFDESSLLFGGDPESFVKEMAEKKALSLAASYEDPILTADTVVFFQGKLYMKPQNLKDARQMLTELNGKKAHVFTGLCLHYQNKRWMKSQESTILFHPLNEEKIRKYHEAFDCFDRAGGFYVQKAGSVIIKEIHGCFYNIMGLPITATRDLLQEIGIDLWDYLKPE